MKSVEVICHRCKHKWTFASLRLANLGKYPVYAQCPNCRTSVKIKEKKMKVIEEGVIIEYMKNTDELLEKKVSRLGNSGHISIPSKHIGKTAKIVIVKENKNE